MSTSGTGTAVTSATRGPRSVGSLFPEQHGAWAFLILPLVLGALVSPWTPLILLLALAWVAAYPMSWAASGLVRARRSQRFRRPFVLWLAVTAPPALALLVVRPWLMWVGALYLVGFAINLHYARRNRERALGNDLVLIAECTLMVLVVRALAVGERTWLPPIDEAATTRLAVVAALCALLLLGSTLHVKSLIRERRDPRFARASRVFAVASVPAVLGLALLWGLPEGLWLVPAFVPLAVRAFVVARRRPMRPGRIGLLELAGFLLVVAGVVAARWG
ncbi:YwiC-like family protein [Nocardioides pacificus]